MKRKPDILVVLAALLGIGMLVSSFAEENVVSSPHDFLQARVVTAK